MGYDYATLRPMIFTEEAQPTFLAIRDAAKDLIAHSGAVTSAKLIAVGGGTCDTWTGLACIDRLVELGEIKEITDPEKVWGQSRVFVGRPMV